MKLLVFTITAIYLLGLSEACTSDHTCTTTRCSDGYHQFCNTATSICSCRGPIHCQDDAACPTGHMSGCPPFGALCENHQCKCHHN